MTPKATKEKILLATIDAIEKNGIHNITTRVIAEEAGVNNAALHYYYGTKEQLVEAALTATIEHWVNDTAEIIAREELAATRLQAVFEYMIDGVLRLPNLVRANLQGPLMEGDANSPFLRMLSNWLEQAYAGLDVDLNPEKKANLKMMMHYKTRGIL